MPMVGRIEAADTTRRLSHADGIGSASIDMPALSHGLAGEELVEYGKTVAGPGVDTAPWVELGRRLVPAMAVRGITAIAAPAVA